MTMEIQRNKDYNNPMHTEIAIWKQEREFNKKISTERKYRNEMRRLREEED